MHTTCANCGATVNRPPSRVSARDSFYSTDCYNTFRHRRQEDAAAILARLLANRYIDERTCCWEWTGLLRRNGYGSINVRGMMSLLTALPMNCSAAHLSRTK